MKIRPLLFALSACCVAFATAVRADAQAVELEYNLKAACLYNFAKFVEWPPRSFSSNTDAVVIAVLGENPFGDALEEVVKGRQVHQRPVRIQYAQTVAETEGAHLVFVTRAVQEKQPQVLETLQGRGVLTVGEGDGFLRAGGMVQLMVVDRRLRFAIAEPVATRSGLKISSQLLSLAVPATEAG